MAQAARISYPPTGTLTPSNRRVLLVSPCLFVSPCSTGKSINERCESMSTCSGVRLRGGAVNWAFARPLRLSSSMRVRVRDGRAARNRKCRMVLRWVVVPGSGARTSPWPRARRGVRQESRNPSARLRGGRRPSPSAPERGRQRIPGSPATMKQARRSFRWAEHLTARPRSCSNTPLAYGVPKNGSPAPLVGA